MENVDKEFLEAAEDQDKEALQEAINNGADVTANEGGVNALSIAARHGNLGMADFLARQGVPVTDDALIVARMTRLDTTARMIVLLEKWQFSQMMPGTTGLNQVDASLIHASAANKRSEVTKALKDGASIDILDSKDTTPLRWAIRKGHVKLAKYLMQKGANVNHESENGWTPLMEAGASGEDELARELMQAGANPAFKNAKGQDAEIVTRYGEFNELADEIHNAAIMLK